MLQQIHEDLWTVPAPLTFLGLQVNTRMTVCRLPGGGLALISPVPLDATLRVFIDALGPVRAIISPNLMHHLFVGDWIEAYPDAQSFVPPGLAAKRPDLKTNHLLGPEFDDNFDEALSRFPIDGIPKLNESLFFHRASRTLIATDFCFFMPKATGLTRIFAFATGIHKRPVCEPSVRILIRDKHAFRAALQPLRGLEISHLSMCHDGVLSSGASEALQGVLDQLKVSATT